MNIKKSVLCMLLIAVTMSMTAKSKFYGSKSNIAGISGNTGKLLELGYGGMIEDNVYIDLPVIMKRNNKGPNIPAMTARLNELGAGKQVLDYLFQRRGVKLSEELLKERALRNAERADVERAQVGLIKPENIIKENYLPVLMNNYLFYFFSYKKNNGKNQQAWILFHVDITKKTWEQVFAAWNDPYAYDQIEVGVSFMAYGKYKSDNKMLRQIAAKAPELALRGPITGKRPLWADISHVEASKNWRLYVYRQTQDRKGNYHSHKVSTVRATDNTSTGTRLYTIAGGFASKKKGDIAVYKPDSRWSVAANYYYTDSRRGASLFCDNLISMSNSGVGQHAIIEMGGEMFKNDRHTLYDINGTLYHSPFTFNLRIGYTLSYTFLHRVQLMPYVFLPILSSEYTTWDKRIKTDADQMKENTTANVMLMPIGLRANVNLFYPLQITCGIEYNWHLMHNQELQDIVLKPRGWKENELKVLLGLRYCF